MRKWRIQIPVDGFQVYEAHGNTYEAAFDSIIHGNAKLLYEGAIFTDMDALASRHKPRPKVVRVESAKDSTQYLVDLVARRGGSITARDVARLGRGLRGQGRAASALQKLVDDGVGEWRDSPAGKSKLFHLKVNGGQQQ